jgi:hypothetical protein
MEEQQAKWELGVTCGWLHQGKHCWQKDLGMLTNALQIILLNVKL